MWIREALVDAPRGAWLGIALSWARTALLALAAVGIGGAVDAVIDGRGWLTSAVLSALAGVAGAVCGGFAEAVPGRIQGEEETRWRQRVLRHSLLGSGSNRSANHGEGAVVDAATTAVEKTANYRAGFLGPTLASFTSPLIVLIVWALFVDALGALILLVFVALVPVVIVAVGKWLRRPNHEYRRKETAAANQYLEMLEGIGTMKVLGAAAAARDRFAASARAAMRELGALLGRNQLMIVVNDGVFGLLMSGIAIVLVLAGLTGGTLTAGVAFCGVLLTVLLHEPIDRVGRTFYVGIAGRARRDQLEALVGTGVPDLAQDCADTDSAEHSMRAVEIELRRVSVSIDGRRILENVSLRIPARSRIALVGPSGAGKTTLMRVLAGLAESRHGVNIDGEVLVDGVPTTPETLRSLVTGVAQHPGILSTTVADNLRLVAPDATEEEMFAALERAHLRAEVEAMPDQLESKVGDRGSFLSGGQRRRIAIARAFLRERPVLLLDEPTADLDRGTEALVRASLEQMTRERTVVQIAHRLDTTADADLVVVLRDGRIVGVGTPAELRDAEGYYASALQSERANDAEGGIR